MNKPILCFHVGYIPDINDKETKNTYGSEVALVHISKLFSKDYRVIIFGDVIKHEIIKDNVEYLNSNKYENFQKNNKIEILIILRYICTFLDFEITAKKIFLWIQDIYPMSYYKSLSLPLQSRFLLKNLIHKIDGIITLTNWHKNYVKNFYDIDINKIHVIGNAIDKELFNDKIEKQKNKFIWTSHGYRGINAMVEYFHEIKKRLPDAELYIYRDRTAFSDDIFEQIEKCDYIHYGGKLSNDEVIKEFKSSEMWFYPTDFEETYCISALEAQMSKCVCVTTDLAALSETVGDRGVLIKESIYSIQYKEKSISEVVKILNDENIKNKYQELGYNWACEQTWENRIKQWYELFKK